jgi:hypothetical protein
MQRMKNSSKWREEMEMMEQTVKMRVGSSHQAIMLRRVSNLSSLLKYNPHPKAILKVQSNKKARKFKQSTSLSTQVCQALLDLNSQQIR